jgi:hypothetical protein
MGDASKNAERPILNIEGNLVALDPLRWKEKELCGYAREGEYIGGAIRRDG